MNNNKNSINDKDFKFRINKLFYFLYTKLFKGVKTFRYILFWYIAITLVGALFLNSSISLNPGQSIEFIDAFFIAASSFSDTGLVTVNIAETFNVFGQVIVFLLILLGGIGWFAIKVFFILLIFKTLKTKTFAEAEEEIGFESKKETLSIVKVAVISTISVVVIFGFVFGISFALIDSQPGENVQASNLEGNWAQSMWTGFFHANASINNAGFDIFQGDYSLAAYYGNTGIQLITMILFIFGGVGFAIIYDIKEWIRHRHIKRKFRFSLITKVSFITYFIVAFTGLFTTYIIEGTSGSGYLNPSNGVTSESWWAITFNTFSTRNAGFSTIDLGTTITPATKGVWIIMMFIGSGPGSTAGGLRTTTLAIIYLAIRARMKNQKKVVAFNRQIPRSNIIDAFSVFAFSTVLIFLSTISISGTEGGTQGSVNYLFIATSAFGTTGLSTTNLADFHVWSKINIIILMFVGQLGVITTLKNLGFSSVQKKSDRSTVKYIKENINLGQ